MWRRDLSGHARVRTLYWSIRDLFAGQHLGLLLPKVECALCERHSACLSDENLLDLHVVYRYHEFNTGLDFFNEV